MTENNDENNNDNDSYYDPEWKNYKLYFEEKYIELLRPSDIINYTFDKFMTINGIYFRMLDDIKIYIIENNKIHKILTCSSDFSLQTDFASKSSDNQSSDCNLASLKKSMKYINRDQNAVKNMISILNWTYYND